MNLGLSGFTKYLRASLVTLGSLLFFQACSSSPNQRDLTNINSPRLFVSGNYYGGFEPCTCAVNQNGGLVRKARYLEKLRAFQSPVLQLNTGNSLFPRAIPSSKEARERAVKSAELILFAESALGNRVYHLTPNDFSMGLSVFEKLTEQTKLNFVSANLHVKSSKIKVERFLDIEFASVKYRVSGLSSPRGKVAKGLRVGSVPDAFLDLQKSTPADRNLVILSDLNYDEVKILEARFTRPILFLGAHYYTPENNYLPLARHSQWIQLTSYSWRFAEAILPKEATAIRSWQPLETKEPLVESSLVGGIPKEYRSVILSKDWHSENLVSAKIKELGLEAK